MDENSMLLWYPKIKDLDIPQPETIVYEIPKDVLSNLVEENADNLDMIEINKIADKIGYPLFLRTDQSSGKHSWEKTCFVSKREDLKKHIFEVISDNLLADLMGLPFEALVFRKYIPMKNLFTAFWGKMPVNPEIRFFIKDGKIQCCWHWYWIEEAIKDASIENWKEVMQIEKHNLSKAEIMTLEFEAQKVADVFKEDYWSVDFCKSKENIWILIDMAKGERSWHDEKCKFVDEDGGVK